MSRNPDNNEAKNEAKKNFDKRLNKALDKSDHELILLANFYHQHGYPEYAQEIYQALFKMRSDRKQQARTEDLLRRQVEAS